MLDELVIDIESMFGVRKEVLLYDDLCDMSFAVCWFQKKNFACAAVFVSGYFCCGVSAVDGTAGLSSSQQGFFSRSFVVLPDIWASCRKNTRHSSAIESQDKANSELCLILKIYKT